MLRIGLTGGIASGKSVVRRVFERAGIPMLDADRLTHDFLAPGGELIQAIVQEFGREFGDVRDSTGGVDRSKLGGIVFSDPAARERLNRIVHPEVRRAIQEFLEQRSAAGAAAAGVEAALMVETGSAKTYDRLVVAHCPPEQQIERLLARSSLTEAEARARIAAQMPVAAKMAAADDLVDTSGSLPETEERARRLVGELLGTEAIAED